MSQMKLFGFEGENSMCNLNQNKSDKREISGKIWEIHFLIIREFKNYHLLLLL